MSDGVTFSVRNKDKLFDRLRQSVPGLKEEVERANLGTAEEMAALAQRFAPRDEGDLAESVVVTPAGQSTPPYSQPGGSAVVPEGAAMVTAGNSRVRYAHLVEYGTVKTPAEPFFWPAYRLVRKKHKARVGRAISKAIKEVEG